MILIFQDSRLCGLLVLRDRYVGCSPADGGEHAVDKLGPDGIENHHSVLALLALPIVVGFKLRVVLNGRSCAVAQQGLDLLVGKVANAGFPPYTAPRAVLEGCHPGVASELPPVRGRPSDRRP